MRGSAEFCQGVGWRMQTELLERSTIPMTNSVVLTYARAWRAHRLFTQEQVAEKAGVTVWTIVRAEAGKPVSVLSAERIARALGARVKDLQREPTE
jgi:DNA-binding XRE family transcriptional regulator